MLRLVVLSLLLVVCCTTSVKSWVRTLMRSGCKVCSSKSGNWFEKLSGITRRMPTCIRTIKENIC